LTERRTDSYFDFPKSIFDEQNSKNNLSDIYITYTYLIKANY